MMDYDKLSRLVLADPELSSEETEEEEIAGMCDGCECMSN